MPLLLKDASLFNIKDVGGGTLLAWAIEHGSEAIIKPLLENGAIVDYLYFPLVSNR